MSREGGCAPARLWFQVAGQGCGVAPRKALLELRAPVRAGPPDHPGLSAPDSGHGAAARRVLRTALVRIANVCIFFRGPSAPSRRGGTPSHSTTWHHAHMFADMCTQAPDGSRDARLQPCSRKHGTDPSSTSSRPGGRAGSAALDPSGLAQSTLRASAESVQRATRRVLGPFGPLGTSPGAQRASERRTERLGGITRTVTEPRRGTAPLILECTAPETPTVNSALMIQPSRTRTHTGAPVHGRSFCPVRPSTPLLILPWTCWTCPSVWGWLRAPLKGVPPTPTTYIRRVSVRPGPVRPSGASPREELLSCSTIRRQST